MAHGEKFPKQVGFVFLPHLSKFPLLSLYDFLPLTGATQKFWKDGVLNELRKYKHGITDKLKTCNHIIIN